MAKRVGGKGRRVSPLGGASEAEVLRACRALLNYCFSRGWLTYRRISTTGIPMGTRSGRVVMVRNEMQGMADLMIFLRKPEFGGVTLHVEVKSPKGVLSEGQKAWKEELYRFGHFTYFIVRSADELLEVLEQYGIQARVTKI